MGKQQMEYQQKNNQAQTAAYLTRRIGSTTYRVRVVFEPKGEPFEDKILRMIKNGYGMDGSGCGIIQMPQTSRQSERSA